MNPVVLACSTLTDYVRAAQEKSGTAYPVVYLDKKYHIEPERMREQILREAEQLPDHFDTILVCMGFCGGSWQNIRSTKRIVIPRVDDCVSLVMSVDDRVEPCTKQPGHLYVFDGENGGFSIDEMYETLKKEHGARSGEAAFRMMFDQYRHVDIIDTGLYDCYDPEFVEKIQLEADRINAELDFVPGSNHLLEKLFSGVWDDQFYVVSPNKDITQGDFFDC